MNTLRYLLDPACRELFWPGVLVGFGIALLCSGLSVFVVLKRLSFIGQGISHAAFGGVGVAAVLGVTAAGAPYLALVFLFCLAAAWLIAHLSDRRTTSSDTAIGIVLVSSMTLGAILLHEAFRRAATTGALRPPAWESVLFGSIAGVAWPDARAAWAVALAALAVLWFVRRPLLFWAFDEPAAPAFGVNASAMRLLLMVMLTFAIVVSMKLAGVILATALLVLPGAAALRLSDRFRPVMALAFGAGVLGVLGGLVVSFELDWPPGPSIVAVLTALYAAARLAGASRAAPAGA